MLVGFFAKSIFDYCQGKRNRKDRYYFALLEKRFSVCQKAYALSEKMVKVVHADEEKKFQLTGEVKEWFNDNCLFLPPDLRRDFRAVIMDVDMYKNQREDYRATGSQQGWDAEETKQKRKELDETFKSIRYGMQKKIQAHIDIYYDYIK